MDPIEFLSQQRDDHLIRLAILQKAIDIDGKKTIDEIDLLSKKVGFETARILSKMF